MSAFVVWKRLTENDFNAMHGLASPHGHGGGARHIALGVCNNSFPIDAFLKSRRRTATITTAGQLGNHPAGALIFSSNPDRRGGEWLIRDQFSNRHPAWTSLAGFPTSVSAHHRHGVRGADGGGRSLVSPSVRSAAGPA